jgi:hypothetical protein
MRDLNGKFDGDLSLVDARDRSSTSILRTRR